jgi:hypothetical protein
MHHVEGVVDVEDDGLGRPGVAGAPEVDHDAGHADHVPQPRGVLPARDGGLRAEIDPDPPPLEWSILKYGF